MGRERWEERQNPPGNENSLRTLLNWANHHSIMTKYCACPYCISRYSTFTTLMFPLSLSMIDCGNWTLTLIVCVAASVNALY